ncbi:MAG: PglZ domain-containing protein [Athalassotoga sp.]|uniref:PglZ domain-containing protein n=2 Tax=Athalassotoga sp. TaxID=2022597 RepID=UPI003D01842B
MSYIASKIIEELESKDKSLPVVVVDSDELIDNDFISELEKSGWKYTSLDSIDDEFFVMIEAEMLKRSGNKVVVGVKGISEKNFVYFAEYCDRGNLVNLKVKSISHELGINAEYDKKMITDIIKIGFPKDKTWWDRINEKGIDILFEELENKVWDLIKDPSSWDEINPAEMELIVKEYLPHEFGLILPENLKPSEIAERFSEKIFDSYFLADPSEEIKKFYERWKDSKEMESAFFERAKKFEEGRENDLVKNMDKIVEKPEHPFFNLEHEFFNKKMNEFLNTKDKKLIQYAKERSKLRNPDRDAQHEIYWNEFAQLEVIFEKKDLSTINSIDELIKAYSDFVWKFDRLDRILEISNLPQEIIEWARDEIDSTLKETNLIWSRLYDPKTYEITEQAGLIRKILQEEGKQAVIVADALRYELGSSIEIESEGIEKQISPIIAMTPTVTPIGMGALFSSGNVKKENEGKDFFIVEVETGKRISDVKSREENIKRIVSGVGIYTLGKKIPSKLPEKLILTSRDLDAAGHNDLLKFISGEILNEIAKSAKALVLKGYTVHIVSDHGFCLVREEKKSIEIKEDSFDIAGRYKLLNKRPEDAKYEKVGEFFIEYAEYNASFDKSGKFYHGGISIQEVIIPHVIFKNKNKAKLHVSIYGKEQLEILRKKRANVVVIGDYTFDEESRRVYIEVKKERFYAPKPVKNDEKVEIPISFEAQLEEHFTIDLYDADDGSHLDSVNVVYRPIREDLF